MLIVVSQPFFRQRQALHGVTPTCSSHLERLTTAGPTMGFVLPFDSILTYQILPDAQRTQVYHKHGFGVVKPRLRVSRGTLPNYFLNVLSRPRPY